MGPHQEEAMSHRDPDLAWRDCELLFAPRDGMRMRLVTGTSPRHYDRSTMDHEDPVLGDWHQIGRDGLAWYRGRYRLQASQPGWSLHQYSHPYQPHQSPRTPSRFLGQCENLAAVEARIREAEDDAELDKGLKVLEATVAQYLTDTYGPFGSQHLPEGLRLEIHPMAYRHLLRCPDSGPWPEDLARHFTIPVKVSDDLPTDTWRLVIITENVLLGGRL
jgi:hypothetical protein